MFLRSKTILHYNTLKLITMYKQQQPFPTTLTGITATFGESLEIKISRILNNKEPIIATIPMIYTERSEGVRPEFNIRTDRMDLAIDAMDLHQRIGIAKRQERATLAQQALEGMNKEEAGGPSASATDIK